MVQPYQQNGKMSNKNWILHQLKMKVVKMVFVLFYTDGMDVIDDKITISMYDVRHQNPHQNKHTQNHAKARNSPFIICDC